MPKRDSAQQAQKFGQKLVALLKGKVVNEGHWELIIGFIFFFGGIYLLASYFSG